MNLLIFPSFFQYVKPEGVIYFDDIELVYVNKTVGTMKQPIAKLIDVLKKAR